MSTMVAENLFHNKKPVSGTGTRLICRGCASSLFLVGLGLRIQVEDWVRV